jgi:hypothetical protein
VAADDKVGQELGIDLDAPRVDLKVTRFEMLGFDALRDDFLALFSIDDCISATLGTFDFLFDP